MPFALGLGLGVTHGGAVAGTPAAPVNTAIPVISGSPVVGQTLSSSTGSWSGYPYPTFAYQWKRAGVAITGETNATYVVELADVGEEITVTVTATNDSGSANATSDPVTGQAAGGGDPAYLLETGDTFLLESGDRMLLEAA